MEKLRYFNTPIQLVENLPQVGSFVVDIYKIDKYNITIDCNYFNRRIDYLINIDGEFILGHGHYKLSKKNKHIIIGGEVTINSNGKIIYINNNSGHYQPSIDKFKEFYNYLTAETNLLSNNVIVEHYDWLNL